MSSKKDAYSSIFLALKHPVRRRILMMLRDSPLAYTEILNKLKVETGFLNYHLEKLDQLIKKDKDGKYSLSELGEAALALIKRIEPSSKRSPALAAFFKLKLKPEHIYLAIISFLLASNAYLAYFAFFHTAKSSDEFLQIKPHAERMRVSGIIIRELGEPWNVLVYWPECIYLESEKWAAEDVQMRTIYVMIENP